MPKIKFSARKDRYVVFIDTKPELPEIDDMVRLRTRTGREINACVFPSMSRAVRVINNLDKNFRKLRRYDKDSDVRLLRWQFCVVDRLTGLVLTRAVLDEAVKTGVASRTPIQSSEDYALPALNSPALQAARVDYSMFLATLLPSVTLDPVLVRGENPLETLLLNGIPSGDNEPADPDKVDSNLWIVPNHPDLMYQISPSLPKSRRDNIYRLWDQLVKGARKVLEKKTKQAKDAMEYAPSGMLSLRAFDSYRMKLEAILDPHNEVFLNIMVPQFLGSDKWDFMDDDTVENLIEDNIARFVELPSILEQAFAIGDRTETLYISRDLLNPEDIREWAASNGIPTVLDPGDMHVTLLYSKQPVDWSRYELDPKTVEISGGVRKIEMFGKEHDILVLQFSSDYLAERNHEFMANGGSSDFLAYHSHVTLSYQLPDGFDVSKIRPYDGPLRFGPEKGKALNQDWASQDKKPEVPTMPVMAD